MMHYYATPPLVVKYGGNAMEAAAGPDCVLAEMAGLWLSGQAVVLVHGGGPEIDRALAERGIETVRYGGLRVTTRAALDTVEAVLCGSLNKRLVRDCARLGLPAVGVCGQDGGMLRAIRTTTPAGEDLGFVGTVDRADPSLVRALLRGGFFPVVAPVAVAADGTHAYNVNADLAAGELAGALGARAFVAVTNVARVLRDPDDPASGIASLTADEAAAFARSEACRSGMKPKLDGAVAAVRAGTPVAYVCAAAPGAIAGAMEGRSTAIVP